MMQDASGEKPQKSANCDQNVAPENDRVNDRASDPLSDPASAVPNPRALDSATTLAAFVTPRIDRPVVLVGMMGTGKSQLGRHLSKILGLPFADSDHEFEIAANMTIAEYFSLHGEDAFRQGEYRVMDRLLDNTPRIIAAGGGIVTLPATRAILKARAYVAWLTADPLILAERCAGNNKRPLLQTGDPLKTLTDLLEKRMPHYQDVATMTVSTDKAVGDEALYHLVKGLDACLPT